MTPEQLRWQKIQAQEKDTRAIIRRDFAVSQMNTTKWREVAEVLSDFPVSCRIKFVDVIDKVFDLRGFWHVTGDWMDCGSLGPFTSVSIEWLDINPVEHVQKGLLLQPTEISHASEIEERLRSLSVPYHWENGTIRIVGHVRKSASK